MTSRPRQIVSLCAKYEALSASSSVDVSMRKSEGLRKPANLRKDARLTIRIPRELKAKIDGIDRV